MKYLFIPFLFVLVSNFCSGQEVLNLTKYIAAGRKYEEFSYPPQASMTKNFALQDPGLVLVPYGKGVFLAGLNTWLWHSRDHIILAAYNCIENQTTYAITADKIHSYLYAIKKSGDTSTYNKLFELERGVYDMLGLSQDHIFFWGQVGKENLLYHFDGKTITSIFKSNNRIYDISVFSPTSILVATEGGNVYLVESDKEPLLVFRLDMEIDGIEIAADGSVFISGDFGIYRFYSLENLEDIDPIAYYIHGPLRLYKDCLYVKWMENSLVIKIKL